MNTVEQYLDLLPSANVDKTNFRAAITAAIEDIVADGTSASELAALYDLDLAVGAQLDVVGVWVGLSRNVAVPLSGVYFTLDDADLGLDAGYLRGPFDPLEGVTSLDDNLYRTMLRIKIAANHWDGSLAQAQSILASVVAASSGTYLMLIDNFDMTLSIGVAGVIPGPIFISLLQNYMTLMPAAVGLRSLTVTGVSGSPLFGLDCANEYIAGLDVGALGTIY